MKPDSKHNPCRSELAREPSGPNTVAVREQARSYRGDGKTAVCGELIEHRARVVAVDGEDAWVEAERTSACGGCSAGDACGVSALSKIIRLPSAQLRVPRFLDECAEALNVGDEVTVSIPEATLRRAAIWAYFMPLVLLLLGASAGQVLSGTDLAALVGALIAPLVGMPLVRIGSASVNTQVRVTRRSAGLSENAVYVRWPQKPLPLAVLAARAASGSETPNLTHRI